MVFSSAVKGDLDRAQTYFQQAVDKRADYGEAANNLALVLAARGDADKALGVLRKLFAVNPGFEMGYVTMCRIYLEDRTSAGGCAGARATASAQPHAPGRATARATDPLRRLITTIVTGHASIFNRRQSPDSVGLLAKQSPKDVESKRLRLSPDRRYRGVMQCAVGSPLNPRQFGS